MLRHVGRNVEQVPLRAAEVRTIAAASARRKLGGRRGDSGAEELGLLVQHIYRGAAWRGEMHAQHAGVGPLSQRRYVVLGTIPAQVNRAVFGNHWFKAPHI